MARKHHTYKRDFCRFCGKTLYHRPEESLEEFKARVFCDSICEGQALDVLKWRQRANELKKEAAP